MGLGGGDVWKLCCRSFEDCGGVGVKWDGFWCRGAITDAVVMEGRGFGFVTFESPLSAQAFLEVMKGVVGRGLGAFCMETVAYVLDSEVWV